MVSEAKTVFRQVTPRFLSRVSPLSPEFGNSASLASECMLPSSNELPFPSKLETILSGSTPFLEFIESPTKINPLITKKPSRGSGKGGRPSMQTVSFGPAGSLHWRQVFLDRSGRKDKFLELGRIISPWHEVSLYDQQGLLNCICKTPAGTWLRFEIAQDEDLNPMRICRREVKSAQKPGRKTILPEHYSDNCPWNIGMLPQTWADPKQLDEEFGNIPYDDKPLEVVEIGGYTSRFTGQVYSVKPLGAFAVVEKGNLLSWKIVAIAADDPMAEMLANVKDVESRLPGSLELIREWLRTCLSNGPDDLESRFLLDDLPADLHTAVGAVAETHATWQLSADSLASSATSLSTSSSISALLANHEKTNFAHKQTNRSRERAHSDGILTLKEGEEREEEDTGKSEEEIREALEATWQRYTGSLSMEAVEASGKNPSSVYSRAWEGLGEGRQEEGTEGKNRQKKKKKKSRWGSMDSGEWALEKETKPGKGSSDVFSFWKPKKRFLSHPTFYSSPSTPSSSSQKAAQQKSPKSPNFGAEKGNKAERKAGDSPKQGLTASWGFRRAKSESDSRERRLSIDLQSLSLVMADEQKQKQEEEEERDGFEIEIFHVQHEETKKQKKSLEECGGQTFPLDEEEEGEEGGMRQKEVSGFLGIQKVSLSGKLEPEEGEVLAGSSEAGFVVFRSDTEALEAPGREGEEEGSRRVCGEDFRGAFRDALVGRKGLEETPSCGTDPVGQDLEMLSGKEVSEAETQDKEEGGEEGAEREQEGNPILTEVDEGKGRAECVEGGEEEGTQQSREEVIAEENKKEEEADLYGEMYPVLISIPAREGEETVGVEEVEEEEPAVDDLYPIEDSPRSPRVDIPFVDSSDCSMVGSTGCSGAEECLQSPNMVAADGSIPVNWLPRGVLKKVSKFGHPNNPEYDTVPGSDSNIPIASVLPEGLLPGNLARSTSLRSRGGGGKKKNKKKGELAQPARKRRVRWSETVEVLIFTNDEVSYEEEEVIS